jgi:uncharacterized protein YeaO (DUF488 family)
VLKETNFQNLPKIKVKNPNAYFIAVSRKISDKVTVHEHCMALAPSYKLFGDYFTHKITEDEYTKRFHEEMKSEKAQHAMKRIKVMAETRDVFLVCWEANNEFCHRHILMRIMTGEKEVKQATLGV